MHVVIPVLSLQKELAHRGVIELPSRMPPLSRQSLHLILWNRNDLARYTRPFLVRQTIAQSRVEKKRL